MGLGRRQNAGVLALISFDAPSAPLLDRLCSEGLLPRLTELRATAATVPLSTPASHFPAGAYPTVWSGESLETHGLHYPFMWDAPSQRIRPADSFPAPPAIWESIAKVGGRSFVVDPYEARRPATVEGLCLNGWQFRNRVVLRPWSAPADARRKLERRFGRAPAGEEIFGEPDPRRLRQLAVTLERAPARLAHLVEEMTGRVRPDLVACALSAVHLAGHQLTDPSAVLGKIDEASRRDLDGALERVYVAADRALGRIIDALPPGSDVIVFAVHGMTTESARTDLLAEMLRAVISGVPARDAGARQAWRFRATVPSSLRARVADLLPDSVATELAARVELRGVDWATTPAFVVPSDSHGFIRFNLRGRERSGVVEPDSVSELVEQIREGLESFTLESGEPAVTAVDATSSAAGAGGEPSPLLPDLVVRWSELPTRRGERLVSERFGSVRRAGAGSGRSGNHNDDAWALLVPGAGRVRERAGGDIRDIAATALARFGIACDGEPLLDAA